MQLWKEKRLRRMRDHSRKCSVIGEKRKKLIKKLNVASIDGGALGTVLQQAKEAGVIVIAYDRLLTGTEYVDYYTTFDNYKVGQIQGQYVVDKFDLANTDKVYTIEFTAGSPDDNNAGLFFAGAYDTVKPYLDNGKLVCVSGQTDFETVATPAWKSETAQDRMDNILAGFYPDALTGGQTLLLMLVKMIAVSAVVIWVFYLLSRYRGIPTVLIILGILLVVYSFFTQKTVRGRHLYAIGGNMKAAQLSGVKTKQMMFFAYTNMSFIAAIAGLVFAARLNSAAPTAGQSFEMDAIASCFIGGASAYGGTGTISGALIGALIMGVLNNGMSLLGLSSNLQQVVKGLVLLAAVAFDVISKNNLIQLPKFGKKKALSDVGEKA